MDDLNINKSDRVNVSDGGKLEMTSHALGITVPAALESAKYEKLSKLDLGTYQSDFIQAWNGTVYRLRAAVDAESLYGSTPEVDHEANYVHVNAFFDFFVASLSALECFCFAAYNVGAALDGETFHLTGSEASRRNVTPTTTRDHYKKYDDSSRLYVRLEALITSNEYKELCDIRNYLAHQGNPSTNYRKTFGDSLERDGQSVTMKQHVIEYDLATLHLRLEWLINELSILIAAAEEFTDRHGLQYQS